MTIRMSTKSDDIMKIVNEGDNMNHITEQNVDSIKIIDEHSFHVKKYVCLSLCFLI